MKATSILAFDWLVMDSGRGLELRGERSAGPTRKVKDFHNYIVRRSQYYALIVSFNKNILHNTGADICPCFCCVRAARPGKLPVIKGGKTC